MYIKETKGGVVVGLQIANGLPTLSGYEYTEITKTEYNGIKAAWDAIPPSTPDQTPQDDTDAMLVDLEYRLTLLELGV